MNPSQVSALVCVMLICARLAPAQAEEQQRTSHLRLPETLIQADGPDWRAESPSTTAIDDIDSSANTTLDKALQSVPGVHAVNANNYAQGLRISIRGFGSRASFGVRGIRILVDGVPLTLPDGQTDLDLLDLGLVEGLSVARGSAAANYGNAAGGVIEIRKRLPNPGQGLSLRAEYSQASFGLRQSRLEAAGSLAGAGLLAAASHIQDEGYRDHARHDADLINLRSVLETALGEWRLDINAYTALSDDPGSLTKEQARNDRRQAAPRNLQFDAGEKIGQERLALSWAKELGASVDLQGAWFYGQRDFENRLPFANGGQVRLNRRFAGFSGSVDWNPTLMNYAHELTLGLDLQAQRDERSRFNNLNGQRGAKTLAQHEEADSAGLYLQNRWTLNERWWLTAAVRYDDLELMVDDQFLSDGDDSGQRDFDATSYSLGFARRIGLGHQLHGRLSTAFESPTFTELANPAGAGFNPDLEAADTQSIELGLQGEMQAVEYEVVIYRIDIDDELIPFELAGQPGRTFFRNAGQSRRDGLELSLSYAFWDHYRVGLAATFADYRFRDYQRGGEDLSGKRLPAVPDRHGSLNLDYVNGPLQLGAAFDLVGKQFADDANQERVAGYGLVNLNAEYRLTMGQWALEPYAGVRNLLDKRYFDNIRANAFGGRFFEPAEERSWYVGLRGEWGP